MRDATLGEMDPIMTALRKWEMKSTAVHTKLLHLDTARENIRRAIKERRVKFVGGYMVMFDIGADWFTNREVLIEQFIMKVYEHDTSMSAQDAVNALAIVAQDYGVPAIFAGDTQTGHMISKYQTAGFQVLGVQLVKEI